MLNECHVSWILRSIFILDSQSCHWDLFLFFFLAEKKSTENSITDENKRAQPTLQGPENHAAHHVTQECHHPRTPWQLHRTGLLAILISKPAAPFDAECEAHGVSSPLPTDLKKDIVSADQRPPTSPAKTTSLALPRGPTNSGYVRSFLLLLAAVNAAPAVPGRAVPSQCNEEIRSCRSPAVRLRTMATHQRRSPTVAHLQDLEPPSPYPGMTLVTRAPPSRQILAAALSTGKPLLPKTPALVVTTNRVDGHTGSCERTAAKGDEDDVVKARGRRVQGRYE